MSKTTHFEIFVRRGAKGGWTLLEAHSGDRQGALKHAKAQLGQGGVIAVKVMKETLDEESGTYDSVSIFEDGEPEKKEKAKTEPPKLPCFKPQDLFSHHARSVMSRVLKSTLDEWQLIPMELIHRADMLEKLEARSTILQAAIQQVAVAQSANSPGSLHEIFRLLMDLALKSMDMVIADERKGRLKSLSDGSIAAFWNGRTPGPDSGYQLAAGIAKQLKTSNGWAGKIRSLVELTNDLPSDEAKRLVSLETIDSFIAEMIRSPASIADLLGPREDLGAALFSLASLFLGTQDAGQRPAHLEPLAKAMANGTLGRSRGALAERILAEIRSPTRFHPESVERELETMRRLAQQLVMGVCAHLPLDAVTEAFASRSKRLTAPDQIEAYLAGIDSPDARLSRLIALGENVAGAQAKRAVAGFIRSQLNSPKTETHFTAETTPILARLRRIAELQAGVKKGHFETADARDMLKGLDTIATRTAERAQFFKSLDQSPASSADKALGLLRLIAKQLLPEGECETKAKVMALGALKRPDFAATLCPQNLGPQERQARTEELRTLLKATGL
jgi:hypothetical protein